MHCHVQLVWTFPRTKEHEEPYEKDLTFLQKCKMEFTIKLKETVGIFPTNLIQFIHMNLHYVEWLTTYESYQYSIQTYISQLEESANKTELTLLHN